MTAAAFQALAHSLPLQPGIYKYFDAEGNLLYVGKAKQIRKRVSSYFNKTQSSYKTYELVRRIHRIEFTIVDSEQDAFLLENALIKTYQPRFNIDLKDDKTYPYIVLKKEPFPRVFLTRKKINDGSVYLGPFTSAGRVREILELIKRIIPLRTCKLNLSPAAIARGKYKVCLEYHLGNCKGPCEGLQSEADYLEGLEQVKHILKGNLEPVLTGLRQSMQAAAADLQFERAEALKKKLVFLEAYQAKSVIVSRHLGSLDVFTLVKEGPLAYVNYLMVENGTIVQTHSVPLETKLSESEEEVLAYAIGRLRRSFNSLAREILVPFPLEYAEADVVLTVPKAGDKKKLLELSFKNVAYFKDALHRKNMLRLEGKSDQEQQKVLYDLQAALQLQAAPLHIECFDNSNFQGSSPVSAMVCFKNGLPSKTDYRKFKVKTVKGINDFATMAEVVERRYSRLLAENAPLPDLVIIDGGKGQLGAALESLEKLGLRGKINVVGLAKNEEEIFFPGDQASLKLPWDSPALLLVRRIRDEVHRFGIGFHRDLRSKQTFKNELENIPGIGPKSMEALLQTFKSVKGIASASPKEWEQLLGAAKAAQLKTYFEGQKKGPG